MQVRNMSQKPDHDEKVEILKSDLAQKLFHEGEKCTFYESLGHGWLDSWSERVDDTFQSSSDSAAISQDLLSIGRAALLAFLQANVTGPPLTWSPVDLIFPDGILKRLRMTLEDLRRSLRDLLSVDGAAVYGLLPYPELFAFATCILNHASLKHNDDSLRWRLRVNTWHQRLLSEISPSLQVKIYDDLQLLGNLESADLLVERASIHILHGLDVKARNDLQAAARKRGFDFKLTGRLGKRTKFQQKETSQLLVLAKSAGGDGAQKLNDGDTQPQTLTLDDDTLLEKIDFSKEDEMVTNGNLENDLPKSLRDLDPARQPALEPLDNIILLATASSVTNTSPQDGLTREETLPYVERVISGGSHNWQIHTQALLVRSRIEGYRSRTAERGVLQLQALVDQVIAETSKRSTAAINDGITAGDDVNTFLPRPKPGEAASAGERLEYIHHLGSPPRWQMQSELADRWVTLGAIRTAVEIYERLQLWAEVALCYAASNQEERAISVIEAQLYVHESATSPESDSPLTGILTSDQEKKPLPGDAPRLFCILGDLKNSAAAYERAWEVSAHRYARAQRSLGKLFMSQGDAQKAEGAYAGALHLNPQNHATWFALGCVRLQLQLWTEAAEAFSRAVQIDSSDGESWSNLAAALWQISESLEGDTTSEERTKRLQESFTALKQAANAKRESYRIWQNLLNVAIKLEPPPYSDIVIAQTKLIELLGATQGEKCIDVPIMQALLSDVVHLAQDKSSSERKVNGTPKPVGLAKMVIDLIRKKITPLITSSRQLWLLTAKLDIYLAHPQAALTAYEKAWRSQLNQPGWDTTSSKGSEVRWREVAESTIDLLEAYESLGEQIREAGMGEGELVAKDWKFKARSAARSVLARAKDSWEDDEAYVRLQGRLQELKSG